MKYRIVEHNDGDGTSRFEVSVRCVFLWWDSCERFREFDDAIEWIERDKRMKLKKYRRIHNEEDFLGEG